MFWWYGPLRLLDHDLVVLLRAQSVGHLFGDNVTDSIGSKVIFCLFIIIGSAMKLGPSSTFPMLAIFSMALVNIIGLKCLMPVVKRELGQLYGPTQIR